MADPVTAPSSPLSADLRERLITVLVERLFAFGSMPDEAVDAIVRELVAAGWRHLPSVMADDEASAGTFAADQCQKCGHPLSVHHVYGLCAGCSR